MERHCLARMKNCGSEVLKCDIIERGDTVNIDNTQSIRDDDNRYGSNILNVFDTVFWIFPGFDGKSLAIDEWTMFWFDVSITNQDIFSCAPIKCNPPWTTTAKVLSKTSEFWSRLCVNCNNGGMFLPTTSTDNESRTSEQATITFWSHVGLKTFCKTTRLTLIPSRYINDTFPTFLACVLKISTKKIVENIQRLSEIRCHSTYAQFIKYSTNRRMLRLKKPRQPSHDGTP